MERYQANLVEDGRPLKRSRSVRDSQQQSLSSRGLKTPPALEAVALANSKQGDFGYLYSDNVTAKIWGVAQRAFSRPTPPTLFPEYTKPGDVGYIYRELEFWTSGFFPGCLYLLLERQRKHAHEIRRIKQSSTGHELHELQLHLYQNAKLKTTHDLGFMIAPWARAAWEIENDVRGFDTMVTAAESLMTRYSPVDLNKDFLVIVDNLMNLDMLFWAAAKLQDGSMYAAALSHAKMSQRYHVRADSSTAHVVVFDPGNGAFKSVLTNQGYSDNSCWSRGQAWAITGFAQTYCWTKDFSFLETSKACADYFVEHLPATAIPPWDFQAPKDKPQPTDTSAAMIASYGMLLIHEIETGAGRPSAYLQHALMIIEAVCAFHVNDPAQFVFQRESIETPQRRSWDGQKTIAVDMGKGAETILNGATINNYEFAPRRWANHGLVYADYFFLLVGNKLLDMGLGERLVEIKGF
ncbi:hypothetical protein Daesc_009819 [Daldinia eschscholtzii]|uniref:Glucuronyl hydrolase n=1 Tax=Daldinia eschscholtzii TaxID=292717 RepID=A0AAX6M6E8_9PEZI